jgi:hypothetical protein
LPDDTIRQYSSAGDLVLVGENEVLESAGPEDEEEDEEDEEYGEGPALARAGAAEEEEEGHDPARTVAMDDAAAGADDGDGEGGGGTGFAAEPRTKRMRIVDDTANWADAVRVQAEYVEVELIAGRKGRRQEIEQWLVEEKISPSPSIRTVKTGWFYAGKAEVPLEVWKVDARALSEAHSRR